MRTSRSLVRAISCLLVLVVCPALHAQTFVQVNSAGPSSASHVSVTYTQAQVSGDLNVVVVGWKDTLATVSSVTDTAGNRSEEHTSELQSPCNLVCRLLLEKKKKKHKI